MRLSIDDGAHAVEVQVFEAHGLERADRQTGRQTGSRQADRQTDRQAGRQTDRQTHTQQFLFRLFLRGRCF